MGRVHDGYGMVRLVDSRQTNCTIEAGLRCHVSAVERLLPGIARLRALVHESLVNELMPRDVATAVYAFEEDCMQHAIALPRELQSVRRDVRAAVGNYFGAASLAAVDARLRDEPLSELDPYWQDISSSYLEYVMSQLQHSLIQPRPPKLIHFEFWRRDEDPSRTRTLQADY